ncbi:MAG: beta-ketoacyl-ACP reductase [Bacteroidota bacterium]
MRLDNKVAIITGGARGIGRATVKVFTEAGAKVIIWDLLDVAAETAKEFGAEFMKISVSDPQQVQDAVADIAQRYGKIDILVNNAGILRDRSLLKMSHKEWQDVIDVNLTGVFNCTKAVAPVMVENKYGRIITTSSVVGITGNFGQTNYTAAKGGIIAMTKTWGRELGKHGITANAVAPGYIETEMTASIPEEFREQAKKSIPVRRIGRPEDIAYAYLYLASEEAGFVNGHTLSVNGGTA